MSGHPGGGRRARLAPVQSDVVHRPEVEEEAVSKWRKRDTVGVFWNIREYNSLQSPAHGPNAFEYVENGTIQAEEEL